MRDLIVCFLPLVLWLLMLGSIYSGYLAPVEAQAIAVAIGLLWLGIRMRSNKKNMDRLLLLNSDTQKTLAEIKASLKDRKA